jgi:four helix bundle protein
MRAVLWEAGAPVRVNRAIAIRDRCHHHSRRSQFGCFLGNLRDRLGFWLSVVETIQRKDRDLASQVRRAVSSIALNAAEAQGNAGGNSRLRFESALGSLYKAQAGIRLAVAWGYFSQAVAAEVLESMNRLGGRIYGLVRR